MNAINAQTLTHAGLYGRVFSGEFLDGLRTGVILFDADGIAVDCNRASTELLDAAPHELQGQISTDMPLGAVREDGSPLPLAEHASARALRTGEPCYGVIMGVDGPGRSRRWLSVDGYPLILDEEIQGAVVCFDDISDQWKQRHLLQLLSEVNRIVMFASDEIDPLQHLCDALVDYGPYALAWIGVPSSDREGEIDIAFSAGVTDYPYEGMSSWSGLRESGRGPVGTALRTGVTQVVNDMVTQSLLEPWRERASEFELGSCIAIPFSPGGRRAVLAIYDRHVFTFDEVTVQGLEAIAREAEFGVAHVHSISQLATALDGTLAALGQMTETRDPYTAGHQVHVGALGSSLAAAIATEYGLDLKMIDLIRQSGDVHDIGKIAIPSEILTRPGRLSPLEFEMVKQHTLVGYEILSKASLPWPIAEVALQHHERLDGSGYPNGLLGDQIILPARIIAVADVVEAMTQHRPYRSGLGIDKALAEVTDGAGTRFDADVVKCCVAVFEAGFTFGSGPRTV
jgi:HD-GYP domain-containing protein (c-di-GMP phosphodiesterase class II)